MKILHFADAHIDMANYGRHDPASGLPLRVLDFLRSLDEIITTAIHENVELVIFAGDAYRDRTPAPTYQREWGKRIIRLSKAGIRTLLLVGNHDVSPAAGRANAIQEFDTLDIPGVTVLASPRLLRPDELGLQAQVIALPWVMRSGLLAATDTNAGEVYTEIETRLTELVGKWLGETDPTLPVILVAHASIQGAKYGSERSVMLGNDVVLSPGLVKDARIDYAALGHIHKAQNLNGPGPEPGDATPFQHPPVIYPGSIERVDIGEAGDDKYFMIAEVAPGKTSIHWRKLARVRPMVDCRITLESPEGVTDKLMAALPPVEKIPGAIVRLVVDFPREWESLIDEPALRRYTSEAFEFHLIKHPQIEARIRLPADQAGSSLSPLELLEQYWRANHTDEAELVILQDMAKEIIKEDGTD